VRGRLIQVAKSAYQYPLNPVVSTGRRNTCIKSFRRGFNSQDFTWPIIELTHHFVWMGL
jgi:hypothetical protein